MGRGETNGFRNLQQNTERGKNTKRMEMDLMIKTEDNKDYNQL